MKSIYDSNVVDTLSPMESLGGVEFKIHAFNNGKFFAEVSYKSHAQSYECTSDHWNEMRDLIEHNGAGNLATYFKHQGWLLPGINF